MGKKLILAWVIVGFFTGHFASAQTIKLGVRGGTFSPISLYEALAKKNPGSEASSFSTSRPYSLSLGATLEKNRLLFGANASIRRVDIQQSYNDGFSPSNSFFETYDFDVSVGYKVVQTPKSSLNAIVGLGIQTRYDYISNSLTYSEILPDSSIQIAVLTSEIRPVSKVPVFLLLKLEGEFSLSNRWSTFFTIESNLFLGRNYYLRDTYTYEYNGATINQYNDGVRFSNNSISSTLGFRYALFKGKS
jgi:hypothetical protein